MGRYEPAKVLVAIGKHAADAETHKAEAERLEELADAERREQYRYEAQAAACEKLGLDDLFGTHVHNHGAEDGPGLACGETRVSGRLTGKCLRDAYRALAAAAAATEAAA